jgi:hypothetical protein
VNWIQLFIFVFFVRFHPTFQKNVARCIHTRSETETLAYVILPCHHAHTFNLKLSSLLSVLDRFFLRFSVWITSFEFLFLHKELVDVLSMRFSALLCCSSANLKQTHSETDTQVARKFLPPTVSFLSSCLLATTLTHPDISGLYDDLPDFYSTSPEGFFRSLEEVKIRAVYSAPRT